MLKKVFCHVEFRVSEMGYREGMLDSALFLLDARLR
jgi:hypothetical protein